MKLEEWSDRATLKGILQDMERNIPHFNKADRDSLVEAFEYNIPGLKAFAKDYYNTHLPVPADSWNLVNDSSVLANRQISFITSKINPLLHYSFDEELRYSPLVIATYYSDENPLPVLQISNPIYDIEMVLAQYYHGPNCHDAWQISVKSEMYPLDIIYLTRMFDKLKPRARFSINFFPKDKIYGKYSDNHSQFSFEVKSDYELYTFVSMVRAYLQIK